MPCALISEGEDESIALESPLAEQAIATVSAICLTVKSVRTSHAVVDLYPSRAGACDKGHWLDGNVIA